MRRLLLMVITVIGSAKGYSQSCTSQGDETSYGSGDVWIGYVYDNLNLTNYAGYVNKGSAGNPNFSETFGGDNVSYPTNGCPVLTETFSVRYKLRKNFSAGNYQITVGADDGYRLSLDGGSTWVINRWFDQSYSFTIYTATLSGTYDIVLEYYENGGGNQVSFNLSMPCVGNEDESVYGTGNTWNGYIYTGSNFNVYSGKVTEGNASSPNFDQNFGGNDTYYATSTCFVPTEHFSARYRLQHNFAAGSYTFIVGGDDGYRLSIDGGATWIINHWNDQSYTTSSYTASVSGTVNMVLEYYENSGENRVSFAITGLLPVQLNNFSGYPEASGNRLRWSASSTGKAQYNIERSTDGYRFNQLASIETQPEWTNYEYLDQNPPAGNVYYRLRITEADGHFTYSGILRLWRTDIRDIALYPTVSKSPQYSLYSPKRLTRGKISMMSLDGRLLQSFLLPADIAAGQTSIVQLKPVPKGAYLLLVTESGQIKSRHRVVIE